MTPAGPRGGPVPDNRLRPPLSDVLDRVADDWRPLVQRWRTSDAGRGLVQRLDERLLAGATIYPAEPLRALALTPRDSVRVVIVGQDPYHGPGQAEGLAFSVAEGMPAPPSLRNLLHEVARDLGPPPRESTSLAGWARQGVLLLNVVLTVEAGLPGSHAGWGWEALTDEIVKVLLEAQTPIVFMLWGAQASTKRALFEPAALQRHCVLTANHPSPLSARRGDNAFIGCGHFGRALVFLSTAQPDRAPIDWRA
jgi:uracil-DNA glycosylase